MKPEDFLNKFPRTNLNLGNPTIENKIEQFLKEYPEQKPKKKFTPTFFNQYFDLKGVNNMQEIYWESRGWENPSDKVREVRASRFSPNQVKYWIEQGKTEEEAIIAVKQWNMKNTSKTSPEFWKERGFDVDGAKIKAKEFYDDKIRNNLDRLLPTQLEYWVKKGFSESEAIAKLKEEQTKRSMKLVKKETENPELRKRRLWNQIEYWLNKGYSEEQGYQLMQEKFQLRNLQTMKKLIQKNLDEGMDYYSALEESQKHYKKKAQQIMKTRIKNNSFGWQKASKQSLTFFKPLMEKLDLENIEYYVGDETHTEYFLAKGTEYFYSYDFCIPSKKLIIEFHGEHIHPNPNWSGEKQKEWKHCWTQEDFETVRNKDLLKKEVAESLGYQVIEVFETDDIKSNDLI